MIPAAPDPAKQPLQALLQQRRSRRREMTRPVQLKMLDCVQPERDPRDREFLPAALALLEAPSTPHAMRLVYAICALLMVALLWSWFGHLDVYADAPGKVQPSGRTKTIQPLVTGKVIRIVRQGRRPSQGRRCPARTRPHRRARRPESRA